MRSVFPAMHQKNRRHQHAKRICIISPASGECPKKKKSLCSSRRRVFRSLAEFKSLSYHATDKMVERREKNDSKNEVPVTPCKLDVKRSDKRVCGGGLEYGRKKS